MLSIGSSTIATKASIDTSLAAAKGYAHGNLVSVRSIADVNSEFSKQYTNSIVGNLTVTPTM